MKLTYQFNSAQEVDEAFIDSLRVTFKNKPIKILVEDESDQPQASNNSSAKANAKNPKISKEMTDAVVELLFDQFLKKKKK